MKRGELPLAIFDILVATILVVGVLAVIYTSTNNNRSDQEVAVLEKQLHMRAHHSLLTLLQTPHQGSSIGNHMSMALVEGIDPFGNGVDEKIIPFLESQFGGPVSSWRLQILDHTSKYDASMFIEGKDASEGEGLCELGSRLFSSEIKELARVQLPILENTEDSNRYVVRIMGCFA